MQGYHIKNTMNGFVKQSLINPRARSKRSVKSVHHKELVSNN